MPRTATAAPTTSRPCCSSASRRRLALRYRITAGALTVQARSRVHDTTTVWSKVTGEVDADPETLASAGATARFEVDMTAFDAGDFLRNRKLRKDFELERHA